MQTIQVTRFGPADVLEVCSGAEPAAGPGQALLAVEVADVLTLDAALRAGQGTDFFDLRPPYVPGGGVAGRVLATGDDRDTGWIGRRVVARLGQQGACAERAVAPVDALVEIPGGCRPSTPRHSSTTGRRHGRCSRRPPWRRASGCS